MTASGATGARGGAGISRGVSAGCACQPHQLWIGLQVCPESPAVQVQGDAGGVR
jgi:hypothetical protein